MKIIECHEVWGHTETTEGRGPMTVAARFSTREQAEAFVKSKEYAKWCVMGYQREDDIRNIREASIVILDSASELDQLNKEKLKERALAKLTKEERAALGY